MSDGDHPGRGYRSERDKQKPPNIQSHGLPVHQNAAVPYPSDQIPFGFA